MDRILITGSTGFIGSHITEYFCNQGHKIVCLVRNGSNTSALKGLPVEIVNGDITDASSLIKAIKDCDFVIHNAAYATDWGKYQTFYDTNVSGTMNVVEACFKSGINNIIMTGTVSVYGEENSREIKDESFPYNSHYRYFLDKIFPCGMNYYRDTKALAKRRAAEYAAQHNLNLTLIEPVWVYGEREINTGFYEYVRTAKNKVPFLPGTPRNKFHVVYVKDLARAYYLAYKKKLSGVNSIIIGNQSAEFMDRIYSIFCREAGVNKPKNIPKVLLYPIVFAMELFYTVFDIKKAPLLTRGRLNMFYDNIEYSTQKAREMLGFTNQYDLERGIRDTVSWYKEMKML